MNRLAPSACIDLVTQWQSPKFVAAAEEPAVSVKGLQLRVK